MLTWDQHEALRKNIEDYQLLIIEFENLKREYEKSNLALSSLQEENLKLKNRLSLNNKKSRSQSIEIENFKKQILSINRKLESTEDSYSRLQKKYVYVEKSMYMYKARYNKQINKNKDNDNLTVLVYGLAATVVVLIIAK